MSSDLVPVETMEGLYSACLARLHLSAEIDKALHAVASTMKGGGGSIMYLFGISDRACEKKAFGKRE